MQDVCCITAPSWQGGRCAPPLHPPSPWRIPALSLHPPLKRSAVSSLVRVLSPDTRQSEPSPQHPDQGHSALWKPDASEGSTVRRLNAASALPLNLVQPKCRSACARLCTPPARLISAYERVPLPCAVHICDEFLLVKCVTSGYT